METKTFVVPGMSCAHCERAVEEELLTVDGVAQVVVALDTKLVTVTGLNLDEPSLRAAIADAGYEAA
jgi:copper chaperone CopZ